MAWLKENKPSWNWCSIVLSLVTILVLSKLNSSQAADQAYKVNFCKPQSPAMSVEHQNDKKGKQSIGMANPSAVYCEALGFEYRVNTNSDGSQTGSCLMPDKTECGGWAFLGGKCGLNYNFCAMQGFDTKIKKDGQNPISPEYAVCVSDGKEMGSVTSLMNLVEMSAAGNAPSPRKNSAITAQGVDNFSNREPPQKSEENPLTLPSAFDWANQNYFNFMTPVRNQGSCGSCWAFASVGVVEGQLNVDACTPDLDKDLSEQQLISKDLTGNQCCTFCGNCTGTLVVWPSYSYMKYYGIVPEWCSHYEGQDNECDLCSDWENQLTTIKNYGEISESEIKEKLQHGPVQISLDMSGHWDINGVYRCNDPFLLDHAVVVTGYDDNWGGGSWIVKNSWGADWIAPQGPHDGYFYLGYGECNMDSFFSETYYVETNTSPITPTLIVNLPDAPSEARWRFEGELEWYKSEEIVPDVPLGETTIQFNYVEGWLEPMDQFLEIHEGCNVASSGRYQRNSSSLQELINNAKNGEIILVPPGTYNENLDFKGKNITLKSEQGAGKTILDGGADGPVVRFVNGERSGAVLDGFTLKDGFTPLLGAGGILIERSSPTIKNCIIGVKDEGNYGQGGGIGIYDGSSPNIINSVITENTGLGGIYVENSSPLIMYCTITGNQDYGIYFSNSASARVANTIVWNNLWGEIIGQANISFSNIKGGHAGPGNINQDPLFTEDNYHLNWESPCIDAGTDAYVVHEDIDREGRPLDIAGRENAGNNGFDIGAVEFGNTGMLIKSSNMAY